jgi:hypothetical protein
MIISTEQTEIAYLNFDIFKMTLNIISQYTFEKQNKELKKNKFFSFFSEKFRN